LPIAAREGDQKGVRGKRKRGRKDARDNKIYGTGL